MRGPLSSAITGHINPHHQKDSGSKMKSHQAVSVDPDTPLPSIEVQFGTSSPSTVDFDTSSPSAEPAAVLTPITRASSAQSPAIAANFPPLWIGGWGTLPQRQPPKRKFALPTDEPKYPSKRRYTVSPYPRKDPRTGYVGPVLIKGRGGSVSSEDDDQARPNKKQPVEFTKEPSLPSLPDYESSDVDEVCLPSSDEFSEGQQTEYDRSLADDENKFWLDRECLERGREVFSPLRLAAARFETVEDQGLETEDNESLDEYDEVFVTGHLDSHRAESVWEWISAVEDEME